MSNVVTIKREEQPYIDVEAIQVLQNALGYEASRTVFHRASYEIGDRMAQIEAAVFAEDWDRVRVLANSLSALSIQIGLSSVAAIARDAVACLDRDDEIALSAVIARLMIHGEEALFSAAEFVA